MHNARLQIGRCGVMYGALTGQVSLNVEGSGKE